MNKPIPEHIQNYYVKKIIYSKRPNSKIVLEFEDLPKHVERITKLSMVDPSEYEKAALTFPQKSSHEKKTDTP